MPDAHGLAGETPNLAERGSNPWSGAIFRKVILAGARRGFENRGLVRTGTVQFRCLLK